MATTKALKPFFALMVCYITLGSFSLASMRDLSPISLSDYQIIAPNNTKQLQQLAIWDADDAVFAPNITTLAIATDNLITLVDLIKIGTPTVTLHTELTKGRLSFNGDGTRLIYQDNNGKFDLWETSSATKISITGLNTIKAFSPTLQLFAAEEDNTIILYNLDGSKSKFIYLLRMNS